MFNLIVELSKIIVIMFAKLRPLFKQAATDLSKPYISNVLTLGRIALTPFMVLAIVHHRWQEALMLLAIAGATDFLDGYLARLFNQESLTGRLLDPLADKVFLVASICALAYTDVPSLHIPDWFALFVALREVLMVGGAIIMAAAGETQEVKPTIFGKFTTFFLILFIAWLILCYILSWRPEVTYSVALSLIVAFLVFSLLHYAKIAIQLLSEKE